MKPQTDTILRILGSIFILLVITAYLSGPVIAAKYEIGDRRGPRIYPESLHHALFLFTWKMTAHKAKKPRIVINPPPRPWFYNW